MIFGFIIEIAVALLLIIFGLIICLTHKPFLLHDYHYQNVKEEDMRSYTRLMGLGLVIMGGGIGVTGFLNLFESKFWWIPLVLGFVIGLLIFNHAQKKYNGSWFS